jgi:hypothetical protein
MSHSSTYYHTATQAFECMRGQARPIFIVPWCAAQERSSIKAVHDSLFSSTTGELRALALAPDFNDTLWAACTVNSRCFSDAAGRELLSLMVPLADMANHSNEPNAGFKLNPGTQTFSIISTKVRVTDRG